MKLTDHWYSTKWWGKNTCTLPHPPILSKVCCFIPSAHPVAIIFSIIRSFPHRHRQNQQSVWYLFYCSIITKQQTKNTRITKQIESMCNRVYCIHVLGHDPITFSLMMMMMNWCLMSSDVMRHIRDKLWPMPKHGAINLYVHGNQKAR